MIIFNINKYFKKFKLKCTLYLIFKILLNLFIHQKIKGDLQKEEEDQEPPAEAPELTVTESISVEDLSAFTLDDVELADDETEGDQEEEGDLQA